MTTLPDLLTIDDIAAMYQVSRTHARDVIVKAPGFPEPAPGTTTRKPRWLASKVRAYLQRDQRQTGAERPHASRTQAVTV